MNLRILFMLLCCMALSANAQKGFQFETRKNRVVIPFKLINNLIFIPVTVNGIELNFLLDTGVEETILLSLEDKNEVKFFNVQKVKLKGLGSDEAIEGLRSSNNVVAMGGLVDKDHDLYIVLDQSFNFSTHIGIPVNGILGYHFFKSNLIEIDYDKKKIIVHKENAKIRKKIEKKYAAIPITIERNKPYMMASVTIAKDSLPAKLLIDIGNSDALWLFRDKQKSITVPQRSFEDYLGKGFSGDVTGSRARITELRIGRFNFEQPIIAFPDSVSIKSVAMVRNRSGSVGGEIFKRFSIILDYANNKMFLRKSNHYYIPFHYNMSGIELQNEGMQWVQETVKLQTVNAENTYDVNGNKESFKYKFALKPVYTVSSVRKDSPAELSGIRKDDTIISINGVTGYRYTLQDINEILRSEDGKWITIEVERDSQILKFRFQLKSML